MNEPQLIAAASAILREPQHWTTNTKPMIECPTESIEEIIRECDVAAANIARFRAWLPKYAPILSSLPSLRFCFYYPNSVQIIMGVRSRDDWAVVRALHKGVWEKNEPSESDPESPRYTAKVDGVEIDCRVDELPPSCKLIEEVVEVAAHTKLVRRIICNEPEKETAAKGSIISEEALA